MDARKFGCPVPLAKLGENRHALDFAEPSSSPSIIFEPQGSRGMRWGRDCAKQVPGNHRWFARKSPRQPCPLPQHVPSRLYKRRLPSPALLPAHACPSLHGDGLEVVGGRASCRMSRVKRPPPRAGAAQSVPPRSGCAKYLAGESGRSPARSSTGSNRVQAAEIAREKRQVAANHGQGLFAASADWTCAGLRGAYHPQPKKNARSSTRPRPQAAPSNCRSPGAVTAPSRSNVVKIPRQGDSPHPNSPPISLSGTRMSAVVASAFEDGRRDPRRF